MRYLFKHQSNGTGKKQLMLNFAVSTLLGTVDNDVLLQSIESGAEALQEDLAVTFLTTLETPILPTNGLPEDDIFLLGTDHSDKKMNIPTEGKIKKGNIIVLYDYGLAPDESGVSNMENLITQMASEIDAIADNWSVNVVGSYNELNNIAPDQPYLNGSLARPIIGIGYLKETQTEDYNPLTLLGVGYEHLSVNPDKIRRLGGIQKVADIESANAKAQEDAIKDSQAE